MLLQKAGEWSKRPSAVVDAENAVFTVDQAENTRPERPRFRRSGSERWHGYKGFWGKRGVDTLSRLIISDEVATENRLSFILYLGRKTESIACPSYPHSTRLVSSAER